MMLTTFTSWSSVAKTAPLISGGRLPLGHTQAPQWRRSFRPVDCWACWRAPSEGVRATQDFVRCPHYVRAGRPSREASSAHCLLFVLRRQCPWRRRSRREAQLRTPRTSWPFGADGGHPLVSTRSWGAPAPPPGAGSPADRTRRGKRSAESGQRERTERERDGSACSTAGLGVSAPRPRSALSACGSRSSALPAGTRTRTEGKAGWGGTGVI